jgi:hypothetical protein
MNLCKFGLHRWEEKEGGPFDKRVKECKDCGTVIKENAFSTEYRVPEGANSRIVNVNKKIFWAAAGGLLATAFVLWKRRK